MDGWAGPHHVFAYEAPALEWMGKLVLVPLQNEQGETGARIILYGGICSVSQHKEEADARYKCGQKKLNKLYYQMKEQRR